MYKIRNKKTGQEWLSKDAEYDPKKFVIQPHESVPAKQPQEAKKTDAIVKAKDEEIK